jgi:hypothetical protein
MIVHHSVVEPDDQPLKLRHDGIFIVARIADQCPAGRVALQIVCSWGLTLRDRSPNSSDLPSVSYMYG